MIVKLSRYFSVKPADLSTRGVFDAHLGIDNKLFIDPKLLKRRLRIPEFLGARNDITTYFSKVIKLLKLSQAKGDMAWEAAKRKLIFKEENGAALGHGGAGSFGRGIGPTLATVLVDRAKDMLNLGVDDPEMFELVGLFQEDFGPDLLSDMAVSVLKVRFLKYTQRVASELSLKPIKEFPFQNHNWLLPLMPDGKRAVIFVPEKLLSDLPIALDKSEISEVAQFNRSVRETWNELVARAHAENCEVGKEQIREMLFAQKKNLDDLLRVYREAPLQGYDFESDPDGKVIWDAVGRNSAKASPLEIKTKQPKTIEELRTVLGLVLNQFKKNVEHNHLYEFLYRDNGSARPEKFVQLLFFSVADAYCEANNVDLSREANAGNGPVDFKLSKGYLARILVEIKKSSNPNLLHGFESQLPEYQKSEATDESVYLIVRVTDKDSSIQSVLDLRNKQITAGLKVPDVFVIDGRKKVSASKVRSRKRDRR